jgi:bifunctional non-homologous end joining protein LigD
LHTEQVGPLAEYRRKRNADLTSEPMPQADAAGSGGSSFVVQEHHARALHWDFRLERDGVLVSWAVPKGLPPDPKVNHLAVQTEDHPLEYASFEGKIPAGEYGGGQVTIWDRGTYELEKWNEREVMVVLDGERVSGRFVLFRTKGKNWMMHRMDGPAIPGWAPLPEHLEPMLATPGALPPAEVDDQWGFEMKWDGVRTLARVEGGRVTLTSRNDIDMTVAYPELRALGEQLGTTQVLLDGEIVTFDAQGRPSFGRLQKRMHVSSAAVASRLAASDPAILLLFDILHLEGQSTVGLPYRDRRNLLEGLALSGAAWQTPPAFSGNGTEAVRISQEQGLEGVLAKRLASLYIPGRRSPDWVKVKNIRMQEVIIGGWRPGSGRREDTIGSLLLGLPGNDSLLYAGKVGTGFTQAALADLMKRLKPLSQKANPFGDIPRADAREAQWVRPETVGEVVFTEWTSQGRLRHPAWRGLRPDKRPDQVKRET